MPIFEKPPLDTLTPARERWTPLYLEHGRLHVDDSSVKWISADRTVFRIPIACLSVLMLGPGSTVTHAAIKACSDSNTPICWVGQDGLRFYAFGVTPTSDNANALRQIKAHGSIKERTVIARRMFSQRFPDVDVQNTRIDQLRGMEGQRVRNLYTQMGVKHGISWKGRSYNTDNWDLADNINKAVSAANAALYALTTSVVCSMGFLPQLGFVHTSGTLPFVYDIADLYKHETTLEAAFQAVSLDPNAEIEKVLEIFKLRVEQTRLLKRIPRDLTELLA